MATLEVIGPIDQTIENVTRDQLNALLNEVQPRFIEFFVVIVPDTTIELKIGNPVKGHATLVTFIGHDVERTAFDNIPDAISAFRELTAPLIN